MVKDREFYKKILAIMLPVALQQAINMGVNMMDTMMLGSLGEEVLSASSLANQYYQLYTIFCMGIIGGSSVLASQYWGAGDRERVRETFRMAIQMALFISLLFALATWFFPGQIMMFYTPEEPVILQGIRYLRLTAFVFVLHGTGFVAALMMRTVGKPRLGLIVSAISFFVNISANYVFIFGKFGAPRLEIAGAALGTLIARATEFLVVFIYIFIFDRTLELRPRHLRGLPSWRFMQNYFKIGAPVLVSDALLGLGGNIVSVVMGHMGSAVVAANAVCMVIDRLCTVVISGVGNASSIMIGNTVGRGEKKKAMEQGETFCVLSILFGIFSALLVLWIGPLTISAYTLAEETIRLTHQMMNAYALIVFLQCIQSVMTKGVLRGGGDTRFLMIADILFMWLVSIPLGSAGGLLFGWPAWSVTICLRIDYAIKSVWCVFRLKSEKWIHEAEDLEEARAAGRRTG